MDVHAEEERDGVRFSWNVWPISRIDATRAVVPLACSYTPFKKINSPVINSEPISCKGCHTILNPYCAIDLVGKLWTCPLCLQRNSMPPAYANISQQALPAEVLYTTIEYLLPRPVLPPPVFLFVIDVCMDEDELKAVKDSIHMALNILPKYVSIGLIAFGSTIQVYELAFEFFPKSYVFNGKKDFNSKQLQELLGFTLSNTQKRAQEQRRFLLPLSECEPILESVLEEIQRDVRSVRHQKRPLRSTGVALRVALSLLEWSGVYSGRVMLFAGGACTQGPGLIVSEELKESIRAHHDLQKGLAKHVKAATQYYEELATQAAHNGHVVDLFTCGADQSGFLEMDGLLKKTGGLAIQAESFRFDVFKESFAKILRPDSNGNLRMAFNATLDVHTSKELKLSGIIGNCSSLDKKGPHVGETEIGIGGTTSWKMCGLDPNSTYGIYFEVMNQTGTPTHPGMIQITTQYQNSTGHRIMRVTTLTRGSTLFPHHFTSNRYTYIVPYRTIEDTH
eukprot:TRINITY_DN1022_c0_g1_i3.p1 TRINITY_DN1022_c0_g1~~TRINITY_DN1022_c0_g1_i3.p1  ORF type:complete len:507 (-),score=63.05 TRINITY_DN1022_c0_g1_i3:800-2320(-)